MPYLHAVAYCATDRWLASRFDLATPSPYRFAECAAEIGVWKEIRSGNPEQLWYRHKYYMIDPGPIYRMEQTI